jgi:hypothetical protein
MRGLAGRSVHPDSYRDFFLSCLPAGRFIKKKEEEAI